MNLNDLIKKYNISTQELANITGTTFANTIRIIKGEAVGSLNIYKRIQLAFKLSDEDIYDIWVERSTAYEKHAKKNKRG